MSKFFLHNQSLNTQDFNSFKIGVLELLKLDKKQEHIFYRNESCFQNNYFINDVFPNLHNRDIFHIYDYFTKLSPCETEIQNESSANLFCQNEQNGFLGINFNAIQISDHKKICNQTNYDNWIEYYQSKFEALERKLINIKFTTRFQKAFNNLNIPIQDSIISKFNDAINQNCILLPEGNIVKNVSISNKCTVLELRVFSPVALRVYFNFKNDIYHLASIEQKSNPDQNQDIKNAEKLLLHLN